MSSRVKHLLLLPILFGVLLLGLACFAGPSILENYLVVTEPVESADGLVVMAGLRGERLPPAARFYHEGVAPRILLANDGVFAGWSRKHQRNLYLVEWAREDLLGMGVPEEDIVLLEYTESGSIHDALNTRTYVLAEGGIKSLLVVTSDYHTRRTLWSFRHVFRGEAVKVGVYPVRGEEGGPGFRTLGLEIVKIVYYKIRYGIIELIDRIYMINITSKERSVI